jgi:hypothetical protein
MDIYFDDYPPWLSTKQEYLRTCSSVVLASAVYQKDALGFLLRLDEDKHQFTSVVSSDDYYLHSKNLNYTIGFKEDEVVVAFQFHPKNMKFLAPDSNIIQNVATSNVFQRGLFRTSLEIPLEPFIHLLQEGHKLVFTGHCYGGAIAIMIAARLMADQRVSENLKNIFCITFGAPLVTTDAIHTFIPMKQMNQHFHHYIHEEDFLPQILTIIQNAIHFDRNLVPELQKFVKNNLLSSLCVYRKSDELSFVTKFFASSPLSQLKAILQGVMDTMRNEYKPFGQYFLLKMPISDSMQQKNLSQDIISEWR